MNYGSPLTIKEFSDLTGVNTSTLRYYDSIGLLAPVARGKKNGRHYEPFQIILLNFIKVLIGLDFPLSEIKRLSENRTPEKMLELLSQQENKLDARLQSLQTSYSIIHTLRGNIQNGLSARDGWMGIQRLEETRCILGEKNNFAGKNSFYEPFMEFCKWAGEYRVNLSYPIGGYHADIDVFYADPGRPDRFFSQDPRGNHLRQAGEYLVAYSRGYYGEFGDLPQRIADFAKSRSVMPAGPVYISYLLDEISVTERDGYMAQFTVMIHNEKD